MTQADRVRMRPKAYLQTWTDQGRGRFAYLKARGFVLQHLKTCGGGLGCNEFVFVRQPTAHVERES
jgi:hypothetical protein